MRNILTIDVEDWYHPLDEDPANWARYEDRIVLATRRVLQVLADNDTHATFFVLGHVADRHHELVREIHRAGHEVGCHGYEHRFVYRQTPAEFESDVGRAARLLSSITGEPVVSYRAPYFSITKKSLWALPILRDLGFKYDSSVFPVHNHRYGIPDAPRLPFTTDEGI
ncbi:MAG TPA: polysaccharide deacetylase family protein, partial [Longimicrobiaceae bacterium]|nr:polysaccharide deacetylase family protein [Longimicrobiaceae bacterium]